MNKQEEVNKAFEEFKQDNSAESVETKMYRLIGKLISIHNTDIAYTDQLTYMLTWVACFPDN